MKNAKNAICGAIFGVICTVTGNGVLTHPYWHFGALLLSAGFWVIVAEEQ